MGDSSDLVEMGLLTSAVGLKGWLRVKTGTETIDSLLQYSNWYIGNRRNGFRLFELEKGVLASNGLQVKLKDIDDRTAAERLRGALIAIPRAEFLPTEANEYYWVDLVGMRVINEAGASLGTVRSLIETGANDVLVVASDDKGRDDVLIPFVEVYIQQVDLSAKVIKVLWEWDD